MCMCICMCIYLPIAPCIQVELEASLANYDVMVTSLIQGSIEIAPRALHKGIFAKKFIARALGQRAGRLPVCDLI